MIAALRADGFQIYPEQRMATRAYSDLVCRFNFEVYWDATDGDTLRGLRGVVWTVCL